MIQHNHHPSLGNVRFFSLVSHMLLDLALALFMVNINMPRASNILYSIMYSVSQLLQLFCSVNNSSLYFAEFYASLNVLYQWQESFGCNGPPKSHIYSLFILISDRHEVIFEILRYYSVHIMCILFV